MPILLQGVERAFGRVDRQIGEVRAAEPFDLGVEIGEIAPLQQRVVGEIDARRDVLGAESDLLGLGEEIVDIAVKHQPPDDSDGHLLFGDQLGRVEDVELERVGEIVVEHLQSQLPFRIVAGLDGVPHVAAVIVGVGAVDL